MSAFERAKKEILADLTAGAVDNYFAGDDALEALGDLLKIHRQRPMTGESNSDYMARIDSEMDAYLYKLSERIVEDNIDEVMERQSRERTEAKQKGMMQ